MKSMDKLAEINEKGDQYAKRMLIRRQEQNQSPEGYSKSLRRRLSILEALNKTNITYPSNFHRYNCNPFEKEFTSLNESNVETKIEISPTSWQYEDNKRKSGHKNLSSDTYCVGSPHDPDETFEGYESDVCKDTFLCKDGLNPTDANFNNIEYRSSNQFQRECRKSLGDPRLSLGEYFGASRQAVTTQELFGKSCDRESVRAKAEHKGPDLLFGARVLEVLEPEVMSFELKKVVEPGSTNRQRVSDMTFVQDNFSHLENADQDTTTTSFVSEEILELEREIEQLQFHPGVQQKINETPKSIYPDLFSKRMSDHFTPKKLFHANVLEEPDQIHPTESKLATQTEIFESFKKPSSPQTEIYSTPMANSYLNNLEYNHPQQNHHDASAMSFLKRNTSFLLNNFHMPKIMRRKPNLESTRKISNNGGKTTSPVSQAGTTISTLTLPNTPSSPQAYETTSHQQERRGQHLYSNGHRNMDPTIPYEVENFLELALGDEQYNTTVTYAPSDMRDRTNSHVNASELISEDRTPIKNRIQRMMRVPMTEPPKHSSTLNRTLTIYKTLTQRIRKKFRGSIKDEPRPESQELRLALTGNLNENVKKLLEEVDIQQTLIYQASKALDLCTSMREFVSSSERVESERLLFLAKLRKKAALDEIRRLTSQQPDANMYRERGEVILSEISLQLREEVLRRERQNGDIVEWLVIIVTEGLTVWATRAVACPINSPRLFFPDHLSIPGLTPDFRLSLKVYSLKLQQEMIYNHEDKYHIVNISDGSGHSTTCPSPKKLLWRSDKKKPIISPKQHEIRFSGIKETSFIICGSLELMLHDLNLSSPWPLIGVPPKSVLHGTIDLKLSCRLQLSISHSGFLTHGDEVGGLASWNRRWCVLEGHKILFWNYPRDQESRSPLYVIDLVNCISRRIDLIDRTLCAKPRTLLVETVRRRNPIDKDSIVVECRSTCTIVRNLLSCDSNKDLIEWQSKLNHVLSALREWNVIDAKSLPQVSDL